MSYLENVMARRRQGALVLSGLLVLLAPLWSVHDGIFLAALVAAGGLLWSSRGWRAWALAAAIAASGFWWSSTDERACSVGSKGRLICEKLIGHLPYMEWSSIWRAASSVPCYASAEQAHLAANIKQLNEKLDGGRKLELYQTPLGNFWIPAPGRELLHWLLWEILVQQDYESGEVKISSGDTVVDCGAHIGVFTRYALSRGAGLVVAIEPDPVNTALLEENFREEVAAGRVKLVKAGVWDQKTSLPLFLDDNSARHSFVVEGTQSRSMPVLPLDEIAGELELRRVDLIKMDIEGSERHALKGSRRVIARFKPKMAICTYHLKDDPTVIPAVVKSIHPAYRIHAKDVSTGLFRYAPKVMFFYQ